MKNVIPIEPKIGEYKYQGIKYFRTQFPLRLADAISIN